MIYGVCVKVIEQSTIFHKLKKANRFLSNKDLCIKTLKAIGLKYNLNILYDVNVRPHHSKDIYYTTDLFWVSDTKAVDVTDEMKMLTLSTNELDIKDIPYHKIDTCGWEMLYSNEKDYYELRKFDIEAYMKGGELCRGD